MPRFALLTHDFPFCHWDFLLESDEACRTWRLLDDPENHGSVVAEALAPHRLLYLDYEGPVSGDRGAVTRIDSGPFDWLIDQADLVEVALSGARIKSRVQIRRISGNEWVWERLS